MLNDNTADGHDVSWIWDADVEVLDGKIATVCFSGGRAADMALRFKYAGLLEDRVLPGGKLSSTPNKHCAVPSTVHRQKADYLSFQPIPHCWMCARCSQKWAMQDSTGRTSDAGASPGAPLPHADEPVR